MLTLLNRLLNFSIAVIAFLMFTSLTTKYLGFPAWSGGIILIVIGIFLYFTNIFLIKHYIDKEVPGLLDIDLNLPKPEKGQEYLWEKTAGTGIVPKWVSFLGLLSFPSIVAALIWFATWYW